MAVECFPEIRQGLLKALKCRTIPMQQETQRSEKVAVMIIFNFLIQREHFVRSSGQQEQANARKAKQRLRQISRFVFPVQRSLNR